MKIHYRFTDGTSSEVEVNEEIREVILTSRRSEHANNEKHRYHTAFSIDSLGYEENQYLFVTNEFTENLEMQEKMTF